MSEIYRVDATGRRLVVGDPPPDQLVRDLKEAGWDMVVWHERELQGKHGPYRDTIWWRSNIFANMMHGEQITIDDDKIYRIDLSDSKKIIVKFYGIDQTDSALGKLYESVEALPDWAQRKLAVLSLLDPSKPNGDVPEVGRRINQYIFWIYP
jgi:hypothetical protein